MTRASAPAMSEAQYQAAVLELARTLGGDGGSPPVTGCRRPEMRDVPRFDARETGRLIFAELKSAAGTLRPDQRAWLAVLSATGAAEVYTWAVRSTTLQDIADVLNHRVGGRRSAEAGS